MKKIIFYIIAAAAIIFATASFTTSVMTDKTAKIEMYEGMYVFVRSKPVDAYDYLGTVKPGAVVKNFRAGYLTQLLVKKAKEDYPTANAIIFTDDDMLKADVVLLK